MFPRPLTGRDAAEAESDAQAADEAEKTIAQALKQEADADAAAVNGYITSMAPAESTFDDAAADAAVTYLIAEAEAADTWMAAQQQATIDSLGRIASHTGNWSDELAYHIALAQQAGSDYARPLQLALTEASIQAEGTWVHTVDPAYASYTIAVAGATLTQEQTDDADWEQMAETEADAALAAEEADISAAQALDGAIIADAVTWVTDVAQAAKTAADAAVDATLSFVTSLAGQLQSAASTYIDNALAEVEADNAAMTTMVNAQGVALQAFAAQEVADAGQGGNIPGVSDGPSWWQEYTRFLNPWSANRPPAVGMADVIVQRGQQGAVITAGGALTIAGGCAIIGYNPILWGGVAGAGSTQADRVVQVGQQIKDWLGEGYRILRDDARGLVIQAKINLDSSESIGKVLVHRISIWNILVPMALLEMQ
jgi:hypothetical protein